MQVSPEDPTLPRGHCVHAEQHTQPEPRHPYVPGIDGAPGENIEYRTQCRHFGNVLFLVWSRRGGD
jgi:hypothetical protein